jgi:hypothetical protein
MKKVYLVTSGSYSDYGVEAVFSTRELAKEWINGSKGDYDIEEYDLDNMEHKRRQYTLLRVDFDKSAELISYEVAEDHSFSREAPNEILVESRMTWHLHKQYVVMSMLFPTGTPVQDALKVASEKRAQLVALHPVGSFLPQSYFDRTTLQRIPQRVLTFGGAKCTQAEC